MSITRALSNAYSGLAATAFRANVTSSNIANANTAGYVRREAVLYENSNARYGGGVQVYGVDRHQDYTLTRMRREADSASAHADIRAQAYNRLHHELGEPGAGYGLFSAYEGLESSLRELAVTPESAALQTSLLGAATTLTKQFNQLSQSGKALRENADAEITHAVDIVNSSLHQIHEINGQIGSVKISTGDISALEDERQRLLDTIAQYIPIKDLPRENEKIDIITQSGAFLLSGTVHELEFEPSPYIPFGTSYADNIGGLSGLKIGEQDLTPGGGNFAIGSGAIAGFFSIRDTIAPGFLGQLDGMAADLMTRFSDPNVDPTLSPGDPGLFTDAGNALDPTQTAGLAARITVNPAVDPAQGGLTTRLRDGLGATEVGPAGNAEIINTMLDALTAPLSTAGIDGLSGQFSSAELAAGLSSLIGDALVRADGTATSATARSTLMFETEIAQTGVDTDFEMQSLLLIEQAYAANAKVIQAADSMMEILNQL